MKNTENEGIINSAFSPRIELTGNRCCTVEGIRAIPVYNSETIKLDLGKYSVSFFGDGLYIRAFTREGAVIEGIIVSMEFEGNG